MMKLHRYWFRFRLTIDEPHPVGTLMGCGVTAASYAQALDLLRERVFQADPMPSIQQCVTDIDVSELDAKHILPNIGDPSRAGIWFPRYQ
jgi:hypothetical protein